MSVDAFAGDTRINLDDVTALRLRLRRNGFEVIPNLDKRTVLSGWPQVDQSEEEIRRWARMRRYRATGIRLAQGLAVIDIDVRDEAAVDAIWEEYRTLFGKWNIDPTSVMVRGTTATNKIALFVRTAQKFRRIATRTWRNPDATEDEGSACVEIFGGDGHRQFGSFGPHSVATTGEVISWYQWKSENTPETAHIESLPILSKQQFSTLIDVAERCFGAAGLQVVGLARRGEHRTRRVYDLTDDMLFECNDGVTRTLTELREHSKVVKNVRCSASWLEGNEAKRTDRCLVSIDRTGGVSIWETRTETSHREASKDPKNPSIAREFSQALGGIEPGNHSTGLSDGKRDEFERLVHDLVKQFAFCATQQKNVLPIDAQELTDGMTLNNFRLNYAPHSKTVVGRLRGEKRINPVDAWLNSRDRLNVAGIRCEPGASVPLFEDGGRTWINTFREPSWSDEGGETETWEEFLQHLVPDPVERHWFACALACKTRNPGIPGPAILMVGEKQGAGRGTLFDILERFWGSRYTRTISFSTFTGKTYQSQYNEWLVGSVMVFVNESSEVSDGSPYHTKQNTYEHLKEIIDPRPRRIEVRVKGRDNYFAMTHATMLIASNHGDALPISSDDRRIAVLTNGTPLPAELAQRIHTWKCINANLAALRRWLLTVDLTGFDPFAPPPVFRGKRRMQVANRSILDEALDDALSLLPGEVFTLSQVTNAVSAGSFEAELPPNWKTVIARLVQRKCGRLGGRAENNGRLKFGTRRLVIYARDDAIAQKWEGRKTLRDEVLKNGDPSKLHHLPERLREALEAKSSSILPGVEDRKG